MVSIIMVRDYLKNERYFQINFKSKKNKKIYNVNTIAAFVLIGVSSFNLGIIISGVILALSPCWLMVLACYKIEKYYRNRVIVHPVARINIQKIN